MTEEFNNKERLAILEAARALGFEYNPNNDGSLICTIDQLVKFSANVASATAEQIIEAFNQVK